MKRSGIRENAATNAPHSASPRPGCVSDRAGGGRFLSVTLEAKSEKPLPGPPGYLAMFFLKVISSLWQRVGSDENHSSVSGVFKNSL